MESSAGLRFAPAKGLQSRAKWLTALATCAATVRYMMNGTDAKDPRLG